MAAARSFCGLGAQYVKVRGVRAVRGDRTIHGRYERCGRLLSGQFAIRAEDAKSGDIVLGEARRVGGRAVLGDLDLTF